MEDQLSTKNHRVPQRKLTFSNALMLGISIILCSSVSVANSSVKDGVGSIPKEKAKTKDASPPSRPGQGTLPGREPTRCDRFNKDPDKQVKETEWTKRWDGRAFGPPVEG